MKASGWIVAVVCTLSCLIGERAHAQDCDGIDWVVPPGSLPSARTGAAMAYDSARGRLVMFGGRLTATTYSSATWEFDGAQWQQVTVTGTPPAARYGHAMVYDSARHVIVMFGGQTQTTLSAGTVEYDGVSWTTRSPGGVPGARMGHAMAYDSARAKVVLFGGQLTSGAPSGATFEYDGQNWQQVATTGPSARQGHVMAYDSARHVTLLHGGRTESTEDAGTWEWSGAGWAHITNAGMPARTGHCMAFDAARGVMVAFGGAFGSSYLDSTWEYGPTGWLQRTPETSPSAKAGMCMAFDAARARVVTSGGTDGISYSGDTRELVVAGNAPQFSQQPSPASAILGATVSFNSQAAPATSWLWKRDGVGLTNGGRISGASGPSLTIAGVTNADWGSYRVQAGNACGSTPSIAVALTQGSHCGSSDYNCDGDVGTDSDIESFFACLSGNCPHAPCQSTADFNGDGDVGTDSDIESFFRVLGGASC